MTETQTWPDLQRPGYPPEPEKSGWHWLIHPDNKDISPMYWHEEKWSRGKTDPFMFCPKAAVDNEWKYHSRLMSWKDAMQRARELCFEQAEIFNSQYKKGHVDRQLGAIACVDAIDIARGVGISGRDCRAKPPKPNNVTYEKGWQAGRDQTVQCVRNNHHSEVGDLNWLADAIQSLLPPDNGTYDGSSKPDLAAFEALVGDFEDDGNRDGAWYAWQLRAVIARVRGA